MRVKSERTQRLGPNPHGEPAPRAAGRVRAAGVFPAHILGAQWHPVDAPLTQSTAHGCHRRRTSANILVLGDGDEVDHAGWHTAMMRHAGGATVNRDPHRPARACRGSRQALNGPSPTVVTP